jgi:hypothetical protein
MESDFALGTKPSKKTSSTEKFKTEFWSCIALVKSSLDVEVDPYPLYQQALDAFGQELSNFSPHMVACALVLRAFPGEVSLQSLTQLCVRLLKLDNRSMSAVKSDLLRYVSSLKR